MLLSVVKNNSFPQAIFYFWIFCKGTYIEAEMMASQQLSAHQEQDAHVLQVMCAEFKESKAKFCKLLNR